MNKNVEMEKIIKRLYEIPFFGKAVGLLNIERMYNELDKRIELHEYLKKTTIIHVAGTNGKGSVCRFLNSVYNVHEYSVGLFTSPHMDHITERIEINGQPVKESLFIKGYEVVKEIVDQLHKENIYPTFFEWLFAMYLYCVRWSECRVLIVEVGIGGELDTTNILPKKDLSIITPIGMDHQQILGNTIKDIAKQKAGIIAKDVPTVFYSQNKEVCQVIEAVCRQKNSKVVKTEPYNKIIHNISEKRIDFSIYNKYYYYENMHLKLTGLYQLDNLNIALTGMKILENQLSIDNTLLYKGIIDFYIPGRFEKITSNLILDGAHNPMGVNKLIESLKAMHDKQKFNLLVGIKEGKDYKEILQTFINAKMFEVFYVCQESPFNNVELDKILNILISHQVDYVVVDDLDIFIQRQVLNKRAEILVGAGSLYLISHIREIIQRGGFTDDSI